MKTADRVKDVTTSVGTGTVTVSGHPPTRYQPLSVLAIGTAGVAMMIESRSGAEWKLSECTILSATTFSRATVLASSNNGSPVSFGAGIKDVFATVGAAQINKFIAVDAPIVAIPASSPRIVIEVGGVAQRISLADFAALISGGVTPVPSTTDYAVLAAIL
jgi:hypothetical protein